MTPENNINRLRHPKHDDEKQSPLFAGYHLSGWVISGEDLRDPAAQYKIPFPLVYDRIGGSAKRSEMSANTTKESGSS